MPATWVGHVFRGEIYQGCWRDICRTTPDNAGLPLTFIQHSLRVAQSLAGLFQVSELREDLMLSNSKLPQFDQ